MKVCPECKGVGYLADPDGGHLCENDWHFYREADMGWRVPERYASESKQHYRDRLNKKLDDFTIYAKSDHFPDWQRKDFERRCNQIRKRIKRLLDPRCD